MLLFGRMYEDAEIEMAELPPSGRMFCVASAGCTALALAERGAEVVAVDVNPAQVQYLRQRLAGAPMEEGAVDRMLALGRRRLGHLGLDEQNLEAFLRLADPESQLRAVREGNDAGRFRDGLSALASPLVGRGAYAAGWGDATGSGTTGRIALWPRFERAFARHPNIHNPYLWWLLLGRAPPAPVPVSVSLPITVLHADAADSLEQSPPHSFDGFALSNILDGASAGYRTRLLAAIRRCARPGAVAVFRTLAESPLSDAAHDRAALDRAPLWGAIEVVKIPC